MKKISKVELKNATILENSEMKEVVGGFDFSKEFCFVECRDGRRLETDTCQGVASLCGSQGVGFCSGTSMEKCFPGFSGTFPDPNDLDNYYGQ